MNNISISDLLQLSASERIQLAQDLWDSVAELPQALELSESQREALDRRLEAYRTDPDAGLPWESIKASLQKSA